MRGAGSERLKNAKQASAVSSLSNKLLFNASLSPFLTKKLFAVTTKLVFLILLIEDCLVQASLFLLYSYVPVANAVLVGFLNVLPLLAIVFFLFKVEISVSRFIVLGTMLGALMLGFNGWGFQPVKE